MVGTALAPGRTCPALHLPAVGDNTTHQQMAPDRNSGTLLRALSITVPKKEGEDDSLVGPTGAACRT
jgi:hypothetical protein